MMDAFIASNEAWAKPKDLSEQIEAERGVIARLAVRNERITVFYGSMHSMYAILLDEARRRTLPAEWCDDPLSDCRRLLNRSLAHPMASARR